MRTPKTKAATSGGDPETHRSPSEMRCTRGATEYPHFSQVNLSLDVSDLQTRILPVGARPPVGTERVSKATPPRKVENLRTGAEEGSEKIFRALKSGRRPLRGGVGGAGAGVGFRAGSKTWIEAGGTPSSEVDKERTHIMTEDPLSKDRGEKWMTSLIRGKS